MFNETSAKFESGFTDYRLEVGVDAVIIHRTYVDDERAQARLQACLSNFLPKRLVWKPHETFWDTWVHRGIKFHRS